MEEPIAEFEAESEVVAETDPTNKSKGPHTPPESRSHSPSPSSNRLSRTPSPSVSCSAQSSANASIATSDAEDTTMDETESFIDVDGFTGFATINVLNKFKDQDMMSTTSTASTSTQNDTFKMPSTSKRQPTKTKNREMAQLFDRHLDVRPTPIAIESNRTKSTVYVEHTNEEEEEILKLVEKENLDAEDIKFLRKATEDLQHNNIPWGRKLPWVETIIPPTPKIKTMIKGDKTISYYDDPEVFKILLNVLI